MRDKEKERERERESKGEISSVFMANATHNNGSYDL